MSMGTSRSSKHVGSSRTDLIAPLLILGGILLAFVVVSALALSGDSDSDSDKAIAALKKQVAAVNLADRTHAWQQCVQGQEAIDGFNTLMDTLATEQEAIVREASPSPRPHQAQRAQIYRAAIRSTEGFTCPARPR